MRVIRFCRDEATTHRWREPELDVLYAVPGPAVAAVDRDRVGDLSLSRFGWIAVGAHMR
jgi:hypothetical protein